MSISEYEYYKQRKSESRYDLYETRTTAKKLILAKVIDLVIFLIGIAILNYLVIINTETWVNYIIFISLMFFVIYHALKVIFKGLSIGFLILRIRYVNIRTEEMVTAKDYYDYTISNLQEKIKPNEILHHYFSFENRLVQNRPMQKKGFMVVELPRYKDFKEEYNYTIEKLKEFENGL